MSDYPSVRDDTLIPHTRMNDLLHPSHDMVHVLQVSLECSRVAASRYVQLALSRLGHAELLAIKTSGCQSGRLILLTSRLPAQLGQPNVTRVAASILCGAGWLLTSWSLDDALIPHA